MHCDHPNYNLLVCDALLGNKFVPLQDPREPNLYTLKIKPARSFETSE